MIVYHCTLAGDNSGVTHGALHRQSRLSARLQASFTLVLQLPLRKACVLPQIRRPMMAMSVVVLAKETMMSVLFSFVRWL